MKTITERKPLEYYLDMKYPVTFEEAPEGGYFVEIEDLPGCFSQGETVEEALAMIEEARRLWLESAYEDRQERGSHRLLDHQEKTEDNSVYGKGVGVGDILQPVLAAQDVIEDEAAQLPEEVEEEDDEHRPDDLFSYTRSCHDKCIIRPSDTGRKAGKIS